MKRRFPVLRRVAGLVGLLHVALGLLLGPFGGWMAWRLDPSSFDDASVRAEIDKALKDLPEASRTSAIQVEAADMRRIVASPSFRRLVGGLVGLGVAFNVCLAFQCLRLTRGRSEGLKAFLLLMGGFAVYAYLLPRLFSDGSEIALTFAAAWGVGNMGLSIMLLTYYWLWGPILAVVGSRYSSHADQ